MAWHPVGANPFSKSNLTISHVGHGEQSTVIEYLKMNLNLKNVSISFLINSRG
jgi:hypothetical protein